MSRWTLSALALWLSWSEVAAYNDVFLKVFVNKCEVGPGEWSCLWAHPEMALAAELAAERINAAAATTGLPRVRIEITDTKCEPDRCSEITTGVLMDQTDYPFALIGAGCSGCTMRVAPITNIARLPQLSHSSTSPALSNRAVFPSFFRVLPSSTNVITTWLALLVAWGWNDFVAMYDPNYGTHLVPYVGGSVDDFNTVHGTALRNLWQTNGMGEMFQASAADALAMAQNIKRTRVRAVFMMGYGINQAFLMCGFKQLGVKDMVFMTFNFLRPQYWKIYNVPCSDAEMDQIAHLHYVVGGVRDSTEPTAAFTCDPSWTHADYRTEFEARCTALGYPECGNWGNGVFDGVCMMTLVYKAVADGGVAETDLARPMNETVFNTVLDAMSAVDFQGVSGRVTYPPDRFANAGGDRIAIMKLEQIQEIDGVLEQVHLGYGIPQLDGTATINLLSGRTYSWGDRSEPGQDSFPQCESGMTYSYERRTCQPCPQNTTFIAAQDSCECAHGFFTDAEGGCSACPAGSYSDTPGSLACTSCPPGSFSAGEASSACESCVSGRYSAEEGSSTCTSCGENKTGPEHWTTMALVNTDRGTEWSKIMGAMNASSCGCDDDFRLEGGECVACGEGLDCQLSAIFIKEGYAASADLSVFTCRGDTLSCPGGDPGSSCAEGRVGITCADCEEGKTEGPDGACVECGSSDSAPFAIVVILYFGALAVVYRVIDTTERSKQSHVMLLCAMSASMLVTVLQQLAIVGVLNVEWKSPVSDLLQVMSLLTFDIEILRLNCVANVSPLNRYISKVMVFVVSLAAMSIIHGIYVLLLHKGKFRERMPSLIGAVGTIFTVFYISVVATVVQPMQCAHNPNGEWTVVKFRNVRCSSDDDTWPAMFAVACFAVLIPLAYLVKCVLVVRAFPSKMARMDTEFLQAYQFLFFRFKTETYWYVLVHILRSLLLALAPVIPNVITQIIMMQLVLSIQIILTAKLNPWRVESANNLELFLTEGVLLVICMAAAFVRDDDTVVVAWLCMMVILASLIGLLCVICYSLLLRFVPRPKQFEYFLCHHKAGAGACARLLKLELQKSHRVKRGVFIDSDNLQNLDCLFDFVRNSTENLVVLGSRDILLRPWCVGELTTARIHNVNVAFLAFPDFANPTESQIQAYHEAVPDLSSLSEQGINLEMVQETLRWVAELPRSAWPEPLTTQGINAVVGNLVGDAKLAHATERHSDKAEVMIVADESNIEAMATAMVLRTMCVPFFVSGPEKLPHLLDIGADLPDSVNTIVVVCTAGSFARGRFLDLLVQAAKRQALAFPVISEDHFCLPNRELYESLHRQDVENLVTITQMIFKEIAVSFMPQMESQVVLATCAEKVAARLLGKLVKNSGSKDRSDGRKGLLSYDDAMDSAAGGSQSNDAYGDGKVQVEGGAAQHLAVALGSDSTGKVVTRRL